jgi:hypothetical protein
MIVTVEWLRNIGLADCSNARNMKRFEICGTSIRVLAFACEGPECWRCELWVGHDRITERPTCEQIRHLYLGLGKSIGVELGCEP